MSQTNIVPLEQVSTALTVATPSPEPAKNYEVIAEYVSCVTRPEFLDEALKDGYSKVYIESEAGIFLHHVLNSANCESQRFVRIKVDSIPGADKNRPKPQPIQERISFLPDGKIPVTLLEEIVAFFRKVNEVHKQKIEAMAWIVWSKDKGYHVWIPDQRVAAASVTYDWDSAPNDCIMVVDIHSHQDMNAFFSGTDNANDRNNISFSGVVGKISNPEPQIIFRFNYFDKKVEVTMADIFDTTVHVEVPEEWVSKLQVQTYSYTPPADFGGNHNHSRTGGSNAWNNPNTGRGRADHLKEYQFKKNPNAAQGGAAQAPFGGMPVSTGSTTKRSSSGYPVDPSEDEFEEMYASWMKTGETKVTPKGKVVGGVSGKDAVTPPNEADIMADRLIDCEEFFEGDRFDTYSSRYGISEAIVLQYVLDATGALEDDSAKIEVITEYINSLSPEGLGEIHHTIFDLLPKEVIKKIQMNGL